MRVAVLVAVAGCHFTGTYTCAQDSQCTRSGQPGTCEPTGYCAFPDMTCPSGERYDDSAGALANRCVGAGVDAAVDAPAPLEQIDLAGPMYVGSDFPGVWAADTGICNGEPHQIANAINGTVDDVLFQTFVSDTLGMNCAIPNITVVNVRVELLLAEVDCGCPTNPGCTDRFDVYINTVLVGTVDFSTASTGCAHGAGPGVPFKVGFDGTGDGSKVSLHLEPSGGGQVLVNAISVAPR